MRTALQQLYDRFYYGFERHLVVRSERQRARKRLRNLEVGPEFDRAFQTVIRPYWKRYGVRPDVCWAKEIYAVTGSTDPRYIPTDVYALHILPHFNNHVFVRPLADKNLNSLMYPGVKRPATVFKYMSGQYRTDDFTPITRAEAEERCRAEAHFFIKPSRNSSEGDDILSVRCPRDAESIPALLDRYAGTDYIVQRAVLQHSALAALNASSVNTLRVITLVFRGEPVLLSSILRIGGAGSDVDNVGAGGYQCRIRPDGTLDETAYTVREGKPVFVTETGEGVPFRGVAVPSYDRVCDTARSLALHTPHLNYIAWDFAVDEAGDPVLIEFNAHVPGQNQSTCGPTFGDLTEDVLAEVFGQP